MARDDLDLSGLAERLPVEARGLEGRLGRFGAAAGEEERVDGRVGESAQTLGERDRLFVAAAGVAGVIRQRGHLLARGVGEFLPPVADVDVPQPRQPIDVLAPGRIGDDRARPRDPEPRRRVGRRVMERMHQVCAINVECGRPCHPDMLLRLGSACSRQRALDGTNRHSDGVTIEPASF